MTNNPTVLVVDDEELLRDAIVFIFKREGYNVLSASNGREAFEIIKTQKVNAIISDIQMPGGNGIELLKDVKNYDADIPVLIFITAFADITEAEAYDLGANAIFPKPFDRKQLIRCLKDAIASSGRTWRSEEILPPPGKEIKAAEPMTLGRGGAFVPMETQSCQQGDIVEVDGKVHLGGDVLPFKGKGRVKWVRGHHDTLPNGVGVEFSSVDNDSKEKYEEWLDGNRVKSYIPLK